MIDPNWGPWIKHDGKGCPCVGMLVQAQRVGMKEDTFIAGSGAALIGIDVNDRRYSPWAWTNPFRPAQSEIIRYRIRKPRGLILLEALLESLPEEVDE